MAKTVATTDLYIAEISSQGGDLNRLVLTQHKATEDKKQDFILFEDKHAYAAQSGLIGAGLPNHKSLWTLPADALTLKEGENELRVRLTAVGEGGVQVAKTYVFKRGSYLIDVEYEIANGGAAAIAPHAYFQLTRDGKAPEGANAMMSTFTGPAFYTDADKFQKAASRKSPARKPRCRARPTTAGSPWCSTTSFRPGCQPKGEREYFLRETAKDLFAAGVIVPMAAVAPGAADKLAMALYAGPQEQDKLAKIAPGFDLVVDYGWLTVIAAPLFWVLEWLHSLPRQLGLGDHRA